MVAGIEKLKNQLLNTSIKQNIRTKVPKSTILAPDQGERMRGSAQTSNLVRDHAYLVQTAKKATLIFFGKEKNRERNYTFDIDLRNS